MKLYVFMLIFLLVLSGCYQNPDNIEVSNAWFDKKNATYYVVQENDTIYAIAFRYNIDYRQLASINNLTTPYKLYAGQKINLCHSKHSQIVSKQTKAQAKQTNSNNSINWSWPYQGQLLEKFSPSNRHFGIDIAGALSDQVLAAGDGVIAYSGYMKGYGNLIIIKHDSRYFSAYGYNSKIVVREGDIVKGGAVIGLLGVGGDNKRPMIHFQIRFQGKPVDPLKYLPKIN